MNIITIRDKFKTALDAVARASNERANLPVLRNVLLETDKSNIRLTTTNLEISIRYSIPAKIIENGKLTVPVNLLSQIINGIQDDRVVLGGSDKTLEVKTDNYTATVQGVSTEEFPLIPKIKNATEHITLKQEDLKRALQNVVVASQYSEIRPELNSVYMKFGLDHIMFVATDGFRLAAQKLKEGQFKSNFKKEFYILIPLKTAQELVRVLGDDGDVVLNKDENQVLFTTQSFELLSRLVEGMFPDYEGVVPKETKIKTSVNREEFLNGVKLAGLFGSSVYEIIMKTNGNKKTLELFSRDEQLGENKYLLPAKIEGEFPEISFNWRYLLDGVKTVQGSDLLIGLNEENKPAILQSSTDKSYFYVVMPIMK